MTPASLLSDLTARGVEFQANGNKLRFRPADRLKPGEIEAVRQHKVVILKLLRSEGGEAAPIVPGREHWNPYMADPYGPWGQEFVPGVHVDVHQPSRLRGLCSPIEDEDTQP